MYPVCIGVTRKWPYIIEIGSERGSEIERLRTGMRARAKTGDIGKWNEVE